MILKVFSSLHNSMTLQSWWQTVKEQELAERNGLKVSLEKNYGASKQTSAMIGLVVRARSFLWFGSDSSRGFC